MKVIRNNLTALKSPTLFPQFMSGHIRAYELEKSLFDHRKCQLFLLTDEPLTLFEALKCVRQIDPLELMAA